MTSVPLWDGSNYYTYICSAKQKAKIQTESITLALKIINSDIKQMHRSGIDGSWSHCVSRTIFFQPNSLPAICIVTLNPHHVVIRFPIYLLCPGSDSKFGVTLHFTDACVACLIAMETFPERVSIQGGRSGEKRDAAEGVFWLRPFQHPPPTPSSSPSARDGAEPAVCYGVSPPSADRTPPVCFDKAPRCPAGRSLAVAGKEGGHGGKRNVKSCQSSAITKRKWQEGGSDGGREGGGGRRRRNKEKV